MLPPLPHLPFILHSLEWGCFLKSLFLSDLYTQSRPSTYNPEGDLLYRLSLPGASRTYDMTYVVPAFISLAVRVSLNEQNMLELTQNVINGMN